MVLDRDVGAGACTRISEGRQMVHLATVLSSGLVSAFSGSQWQTQHLCESLMFWRTLPVLLLGRVRMCSLANARARTSPLYCTIVYVCFGAGVYRSIVQQVRDGLSIEAATIKLYATWLQYADAQSRYSRLLTLFNNSIVCSCEKCGQPDGRDLAIPWNSIDHK